MADKSVKYNILTRPRRAIHFQKLAINEDLIKQIGNLSDESDDEEFTLSSSKEKENFEKSSDKQNSLDSSDLEDQDLSEDETDSENFNSKSGDETSDSNTNESLNCTEEENEEKPSPKKKLKIENSIAEKSSNEDCAKNSKKKTNTKPKIRRKMKRKLEAKKFEFDLETRKLLSSFKKSNIVIKKPKSQLETTSSNSKKRGRPKFSNKSKYESVSPIEKTVQKSCNKQNSGPYLKMINQKIENFQCPIFVVKQHSSHTFEINDMDTGDIQKFKRLIPREKHFPMLETGIDTNENWVCTFCLNAPNSGCPGIGDLIGPYRVTSDLEHDIPFGIKNSYIPDSTDLNDEKNLREIWFHEDCAVHSPSIYVRNNQIFGIAEAVRQALENTCSCCKKKGANLACRYCNKTFHFPCAISNNFVFDDKSQTISCNAHSIA